MTSYQIDIVCDPRCTLYSVSQFVWTVAVDNVVDIQSVFLVSLTTVSISQSLSIADDTHGQFYHRTLFISVKLHPRLIPHYASYYGPL